MASILWLVARVPAREGREEQRVVLARELVEWHTFLPADHYFRAGCNAALGSALLQPGQPEDFDEAERPIVGSYETIAQGLGEDHLRTRIALSRVCRMYAQSGRWNKAAEYAAPYARSDGFTPPSTAVVLLRPRRPDLAASLAALASAAQEREFSAFVMLRDRLREAAHSLPGGDPQALLYADAMNATRTAPLSTYPKTVAQVCNLCFSPVENRSHRSFGIGS